MSKPLIYAELLSNIRQVSVIAALDTPCDASTSVKLSADGQKLTLHHDGSTSFLYLPGQVAPLSQLQGPKPGIKELSWRLPLSGSYPGSHVEDAVSSEAPWPATDIKENTGFSCRSCGAPVLRKGIIKSWRNLPSENWAEMMDFWHCHKPDIPDSDENGHDGHSHGDPTTSKGYGANAKFTAQPGVGFVDLTTLLASESDCSGVEHDISLNDRTKYPQLGCSRCKMYIGHRDHQAEGFRLYKWRLESSMTDPPQPTLSILIAAQLQSIMLAQCCSRLVLIPTNWKPSSPETSSTSFLSLWILSPTTRYSTTLRPVPTPGTLAMKVFWKAISATEADKLLHISTQEELSLPAETITEIEDVLRDSASCLPPSGRRFQGWDVGLLDRI